MRTSIGDTEIHIYSKGDEFWFEMAELPGDGF
jgi:hypothetical protein